MAARHLGLRGLRPRLAAWIAGITIVAVGVSFLALYRGTGSDLRHRIDAELQTQTQDYMQRVAGNTESEAALSATTRVYLAALRFQPSSRIFVVQLGAGRVLTNEQNVVEREGGGKPGASASGDAGESGDESSGSGQIEGGGLLNAPLGFSDVKLEEAGTLRLLSTPIVTNGTQVGVFRVGTPLQSVERAESGLLSSFLLVGSLSALVAILLGFWIASRTSKPLRRIAATATAVSGGDLSHRIEYKGPRDEVGVLAEAFNAMLARLEASFGRQREFVADASHELRTPLTVIRGQLEVLANEPGANRDAFRRTVDVVMRETDRMSRLVDDLLLLARAEEGTLVQLGDVDVRRFFTDLADDLTLLGDRNWQLPEPPGGHLRCDPDRVAQVIRNLVRNAIEHTDTGGTIGAAVTPAGGRLRVAVSDDGPGIPPAQLDRVFDRFHRTDASRSRREGGAGLGLAIARAIVEAHGGRIWAESNVGEGSTFTFELPGYVPAP